MRVGLDARCLTATTRTGVEWYVVNLVRGLSRLADSPDIIAYVDRPIPEPDLAQAAASGPVRTRVVRARRGWLRAALPWRLWRDRVALVHLPSTILPPVLPCPAIVTVHDLAWSHYPETYTRADLRMQTRVVPRSVERAAHVIAVSRTTAADLQAVLGTAPEKISVVPLGVSPRFSPRGPLLEGDQFAWAEQIGAGYVLYVGALQPRKNLMRLLEAYVWVRGEMPAPPLVLAGAASPHGSALAEAARRLGVERYVVFPGYVPERWLPALYRGAGVFVYPSLYEGFGLPVLEAMASGVPTITSDRSGTAEAAGDAALLAAPESVAEIANALARLLRDERLRQDLVARGLERSPQFTWDRTARETVKVYRRRDGVS